MDHIQDHIDKMKNIQEAILDYIDKQDAEREDFQELSTFLKDQKIEENQQELKSFLHIVSNISNNYHRYPLFFDKIERILLLFKTDIQNQLSNFEIFTIFRKSKRALLSLFNQRIIYPDSDIATTITLPKYEKRFYPHFFLPEFKELFDEDLKAMIKPIIYNKTKNSSQYLQKRLEGENDSYICKLIRNDSITEFIELLSQNMIGTHSKIPTSMYETNGYLANKDVSVIEYAAFFGSIKILKYLLMNLSSLSSSVYSCAIHSKSSEVIHLIEEKKNYEKDEDTYMQCFKESVKCHHNDIAQYYLNNFIQSESEEFENNLISYSKYYNFCFIPEDLHISSSIPFILNLTNGTLFDIFLQQSSFDVNRIRI